MKSIEYLEGNNFSLVLGGPFFQLLTKAHLTGKSLELVKLRTIILSTLAWLPLLLLSMLNGQAWGGSTKLPFIEDFEVHIRFLVALPLMIIAELLVHQRMLSVVRQFQESNLIPESAIGQFHKAIASALHLRNSIIAEVLMLVLIYVIGYKMVWQQTLALDIKAWYTEPSIVNGNLSLAGIWFRYLSLPLFQFLFLRWYFRIFIWTRFLFHVSRIKLRLVSTHPDNVGGLGFLSQTVFAFIPLALVHGTVVAGMIANHIFHQGAVLLDFKIELIVIVALVMCLVILPLFFFSSQLGETKRAGGLAYGKLAAQYVQEFEARWLNKQEPSANAIIGPDIQSLADLANSYKVVQSMQIVPISRNAILMLAVITLAPVLPLVLTMIPLGELLKMLSGVLF